jgi:hypothetical protein
LEIVSDFEFRIFLHYYSRLRVTHPGAQQPTSGFRSVKVGVISKL